MTTQTSTFPHVLCKVCRFQPFHLSPEIHYCPRCLRGWSTCEWDNSQFNEDYAQQLLTANEEMVNRINLHHVGLVARYCSYNKKLLDFGCGVGSFLNECKKHWECEGLEANHVMIDQAKRTTNLPIHFGLDKERYDVITFWDSLDHIFDLDSAFVGVLSNLNPGGMIFVTLPELQFCFDSVHDEKYLQRIFAEWDHAEPKTRLNYFSKNGLERFLTSSGLRVIRMDNDESILHSSKVNPTKDYMSFVAIKPEVSKPGAWTLSGPGVGLG